MASQYKINRAHKLSHSPLPMAWEEIGATLDTRPEILDKLTSKEIALVIDLLNAHWHKAAAWKEAEICAEGYVWSARHQKLLDVVLPPEA
jgi:hypothetical protein